MSAQPARSMPDEDPDQGHLLARRHAERLRYLRWDGTQRLPDLDADDVIDALADDMMAEGDLMEALRRLLRRGLPGNQEAGDLAGLRRLLERLAEQRRETLERYQLGDVLGDVRRELGAIVETERTGILRRRGRQAGGREAQPGGREAQPGRESPEGEPSDADGATGGPPSDGAAADANGATDGAPSAAPPLADADLQRLFDEMTRRRLEQLDALPKDVGGQLRALEEYEFLDPGARDRFQALLERLRQSALDAYFQGLSDAIKGFTPEQLQANRDMVRDLNRLLQERLNGGEPDVSGFLARHGSFFPGAQSLDDIVEQLAQRMATMQSLLASMSAQQRAELQSMLDALLRDDRLRWDLAQLAATLDQLLPGGLGERFPFRGDDPLTLEGALEQLGRLERLDRLGAQLAGADDPAALAEVDPEEVRRMLGEESAQDLQALQQIARQLERAGYVERRGDRLELTPRGHRRIGQKVLNELFAHLRRDALGGHAVRDPGPGGEAIETSAPYEFGRPFNLDLQRTLANALARPENAPGRRTGGGLSLEPADFEVFRTEELNRAATVLLVDMSRSMLLRGCFMAAKRVAVALDTLIRTQFPRDELHVVGFAYYAREVAPGTLASLSWHGYEYGTNLQHGLLLARRLLNRSHASNRAVVVITDGEPTAHFEGGQVAFSYPPTRRTIEETLKEVARCTRDGITINTFMLERSRALAAFVDRMTRLNRGRAFYATPEHLGEYVLVDYVGRKTSRL